MQLVLAKKGTVTDCREALNEKLASLPMPETQENKVVRMIAHFIVAEYLDPIHDAWYAKVQDVRAARVPKAQGGLGAEGIEEPKEPLASFSINCTVEIGL